MVETIREEFEEAAAHVMQESSTPVTIGPLRELRPAEVDAGVVGWRTTAVAGSPGQPATELGELFLLLLPKGGTAEVDPEGDPPLHGIRWPEVDSLALRASEPTVLLLARPAEPAFRGHLAEVAELLRAEFSEE